MINETYSFKSFSGQSLLHHVGLEGVIKGSCFAQEILEDENAVLVKVFPAETKATFIDCNLDNCEIPKGCKVVGGSNRLIKIQNDREDWVLENGLPSVPVNLKMFHKLGIPIDPKYIPRIKQDEGLISKTIRLTRAFE